MLLACTAWGGAAAGPRSRHTFPRVPNQTTYMRRLHDSAPCSGAAQGHPHHQRHQNLLRRGQHLPGAGEVALQWAAMDRRSIPCLGRGFCAHAAFTFAGTRPLVTLPFVGANPLLQCTTTYGDSCVKCDSSKCLDCGAGNYYDSTAKKCQAVSQGWTVVQVGCAARVPVLQVLSCGELGWQGPGRPAAQLPSAEIEPTPQAHFGQCVV